MKIETIRIDWSTVKARLLASLVDGKPWRQAKQSQLLEMHHNPGTRSDFYGQGYEVIDWIQNGFYSDDLKVNVSNRVPVATAAQIGWSEEPSGDIELARLYGGYDDYYYEVAESPVKPGLKIEFDLFFAALVKSGTVAGYGAWLASLIAGLEQAGYDLAIDAVAPIRQLYTGAPVRARQDVQITVKRPGELSDFASWSSLLSPSGTRVLLFTAFGVASDQIGKSQTEIMCMSLEPHERGWGVEYDAAANVLRITAGQRESGAFPTERMNDALAASGLLT